MKTVEETIMEKIRRRYVAARAMENNNR